MSRGATFDQNVMRQWWPATWIAIVTDLVKMLWRLARSTVENAAKESGPHHRRQISMLREGIGRIASIDEAGTAGTEQFLDPLDRFLDHALRLAGFHLML